MLLYWSVYFAVFIVAVLSWTREIQRYRKVILFFFTLLLIFLFGFRIDVGMDFSNYKDDFNLVSSYVKVDFIYVFLRDLSVDLGLSFYFFFFVLTSSIFVGFSIYISRLKNPLSTFAFFMLMPIGFPYSLNAVRQFLAVAVIGLLGYSMNPLVRSLRYVVVPGLHLFTGLIDFILSFRYWVVPISLALVIVLYFGEQVVVDVVLNKYEWYVSDGSTFFSFHGLLCILLVIFFRNSLNLSTVKYNLGSVLIFILVLTFAGLTIEIIVRFVIIFWPVILVAYDQINSIRIRLMILFTLFLYSGLSVYFKYEDYGLLPFNHLFLLR